MAWSSGIHGISKAAVVAVAHHSIQAVSSHPQLDGVMVLGFVSAATTAACYLYRHHSRAIMLTFAASLATTGIFGCIEGAWPLGLLEGAWAIQAARRGMLFQGARWKRRPHTRAFVPDLESRQSRYRQTFGSN